MSENPLFSINFSIIYITFIIFLKNVGTLLRKNATAAMKNKIQIKKKYKQHTPSLPADK